MNQKIPKLNLHPDSGWNHITENELKILILLFYYPDLKQAFITNSKEWVNQFSRTLIKTEIKDNYGAIGTIVYSINGSPPKGKAIISVDYRSGIVQGFLVLLRDFQRSGVYPVRITDVQMNTG